MRKIALMLSALMIATGEAPLNREVIVLQDGLVLVFDNAAAASSLDTRFCYNAVAKKSVRQKLARVLKSGREPIIKRRVVKGFFAAHQFSGDDIGYFKYMNRVVHDFCERQDLLVIDTVL